MQAPPPAIEMVVFTKQFGRHRAVDGLNLVVGWPVSLGEPEQRRRVSSSETHRHGDGFKWQHRPGTSAERPARAIGLDPYRGGRLLPGRSYRRCGNRVPQA